MRESLLDLVEGWHTEAAFVESTVQSEKDDSLVDTLCSAYRTLVPMQRLIDAGVDREILKPHSRCWMGNDKVKLLSSSIAEKI